MSQLYAIVDIETTGGRPSRDKITEIAVVLHDGLRILERFETLLNPETPIPYGITELTGITNEMVAEAPKFYEVARKIVEMTEGAVFVAHNVRFDYSFVREEFRRLGFTYTRKQLCTVRLARKAFPGLSSYSLDNLIHHLKLPIQNRHRALGDALATARLFEMIMEHKGQADNARKLINFGIREALLPPNLSLETIHALPEACGVYYFHDAKGGLAYVGKSKNIRHRVATHFAGKTDKASRLHRHVHDISYQLTGSELAALLLESHEIKRLRPYLNRAQRHRSFPYAIHSFIDIQGYHCFEVERTAVAQKKGFHIVAEFPKGSQARSRLLALCKQFELCPRLCGMEKGQGPCFDYHLKQCHGACIQQESPESYNQRAAQVLDRLSQLLEDNYFILDRGRSPDELTLIQVEGGAYRGFGHVLKDELPPNPSDWSDAIKPFPDNPEVRRIIRNYLLKHPEVKVVKVKPESAW